MKLIAFPIFIALLAGGALAQHCPFDGGEMLVVELVDQKGEPMFGSSMNLTLVETDNPNADACKYSPGLISRSFHTPVEAFMTRYSRQSTDLFREFCEDCAFDTDGFYAVILGQAERSCMLYEDQGVRPLRARTYEVRYSRDGFQQKIPVRREDFFSMCTGSGKWSRFKPVRFKVEH
jgi:hypothetical protein